MKTLIKHLSVLALSLSVTAQAADITLTTKQGFELKGDYFASNKASSRGVLMLHQCNYNRTMYDDIGEQLAKRGIHAVSLDFRGFGESANDQFNVENVQAIEAQEERRAAWRKIGEHWPSDVQLAYDHLKSKLKGKGTIGVIGASCGGSQAITLAEKNPITAMSFFSSAQREANIERYKKALAEKPTLIIAAEEDGNTYTSAQTLFTTAKNNNSRFIAYKGGEHGYPLLDSDTHLATTIVSWFDSQLTK